MVLQTRQPEADVSKNVKKKVNYLNGLLHSCKQIHWITEAHILICKSKHTNTNSIQKFLYTHRSLLGEE